MKKLNSFLFLFFLLLIGLPNLQAQQVIPASGGEATGSGGSGSYTLGQTVYTSYEGTNGSEAQGVQQAYEISEVTAIEQNKGIKLNCKVYPNPTTDYLILELDASAKVSNQSMTCQLFDVNGKLLESIKIKDLATNISTDMLANGTYFLKITDGSKELKTFKIIKNK